MQGLNEIINKLNEILLAELSAERQYLFHAEVWKNNRLEKLYDSFKERMNDEREHSEIITELIIFLQGYPVVTEVKDVNIGIDLVSQLKNDLEKEYQAIKLYNDAITLSCSLKDNYSKFVLQGLLNEEIEHSKEIESQLSQIELMSLDNFMSTQFKCEHNG